MSRVQDLDINQNTRLANMCSLVILTFSTQPSLGERPYYPCTVFCVPCLYCVCMSNRTLWCSCVLLPKTDFPLVGTIKLILSYLMLWSWPDWPVFSAAVSQLWCTRATRWTAAAATSVSSSWSHWPRSKSALYLLYTPHSPTVTHTHTHTHTTNRIVNGCLEVVVGLSVIGKSG